MNKVGKQKQLLAPKTGFLSLAAQSDENGLIDVITLKTKPQKVYMICTNGVCFCCIDQSGNPFIFFYDKNRYINIKVPSPAIDLVFIQKNEGQFAVALKSNQIFIFSLINGKLLKQLKPHDFHIIGMDVNYIKSMLLSISQDQCILWDLNGYEKQKSLFSKNSKFSGGCFSQTGQELVTVFDDRTICVWSLSSFEVLSKVTLNDQTALCQLIADRYNNRVIVNNQSCLIHLLDESNNLRSFSIPHGYGGVRQVKVDHDILILTKTFQVLVVSQNRIVGEVKLPVGKAAISIDSVKEKLIVGLDSGEMLLFDIKKIKATQQKIDQQKIKSGVEENLVHRSLQEYSIDKENYQIQKENNEDVTNAHISKRESQYKFNCSQSSVHPDRSQTMNNQKSSILKNTALQQQPYNSFTLSKKFKKSGTDPQKELMSTGKIKKFLRQFGQFPDQQRSIAWKSLLDLPINTESYNNLLSLGIHPAFKNLNEKYPLQSQSLLSRLQRTLSCLAHYCPLFAEVEYLPEFVFPFVKLFQRGQEHQLFEVILSIIVQFCQHFFEYFPNAPVGILQLHDQLFQQHDPQLFNHMKDYLGYSAVQHAWPSIKCLYTDIVGKEQWLKLIDTVVAYNDQPWVLLIVSISYLQYFRNVILSMQSCEDLDLFFGKSNAVDIDKVMERVLQMLGTSDPDRFCLTYNQNLPLLSEQYQLFNLYPKQSVEFQKNVRTQIEQEQQENEKRQSQIHHLQQMTDNLVNLEQQFKDRQQQMVQVNRDRQEMMQQEMEMKIQKQQQVERAVREKRLDYVNRVEGLLKGTMEQQDDLRRKEDDMLFQYLQKQREIENQQLFSRKEEDALLDLEFKAFQRFQELMLIRQQEEKTRFIQQDIEFKTRQKDLQEQTQLEKWRTQEQESRLRQEVLRNQQLQQLQEIQLQNDRAKAEQEMVINQLQSEVKLQNIERDKHLREVIQNEQYLLQQQNEIADQKNRALAHQERLLIAKAVEQVQEVLPQQDPQYQRIAYQEQLQKQIHLDDMAKEAQRIAEINSSNRRQEFQNRLVDLEKEAQQQSRQKDNDFRNVAQRQQQNQLNQQKLQEEMRQKEQELRERQEFYDEIERQESKQKQIGQSRQSNDQQEFQDYRNQLQQQVAQMSQNQIRQQRTSGDESLREQVRQNNANYKYIRHRENQILKQTDALRNQIIQEKDSYNTGQFRQQGRQHPYDEQSYSPQAYDERIISNSSDYNDSSRKQYR